MRNLETTVAVYDDLSTAENDWAMLEDAAKAGDAEIADAALVENRDGEAVILQRQSRHGWGKGAIVGAVVGILFPPSIIAGAAVGAGGGALISRMTRSLGRGKVKELGDTLDSGRIAIVVVTPAPSTKETIKVLSSARTLTTVESCTDDEVQEAMTAA